MCRDILLNKHCALGSLASPVLIFLSDTLYAPYTIFRVCQIFSHNSLSLSLSLSLSVCNLDGIYVTYAPTSSQHRSLPLFLLPPFPSLPLKLFLYRGTYTTDPTFTTGLLLAQYTDCEKSRTTTTTTNTTTTAVLEMMLFSGGNPFAAFSSTR